MKNEKEQNKIPPVQELSDEEASRAVGGSDTHIVLHEPTYGAGGREITPFDRYHWEGTDDNLKYLCPKCNRPLRSGWGWRYYCDTCKESWFDESNLKMNMSNGEWKYDYSDVYDY